MRHSILLFFLLLRISYDGFGQVKGTFLLSFKDFPITSIPTKHDADSTGAILVKIGDIDSLNLANIGSWRFLKSDTTALTPTESELTGDTAEFKFTELSGSLESASMEIQIRGDLTKTVNGQNETKDTLLWQFTITKYTPPAAETVKNSSKIAPEDYLEAIRTLHPKFEQDKVYQEDNTIFLFIGEDLTRIPGTEFPNCISSNVTYVMEYFSRKKGAKVNFRGEARQVESITIAHLLTDASQDSIRHYTSQPFGPFEQGADFFISVDAGPVKNFSFNACSAAYHVSISAGFFGSSLNNPENITQTADGGTLYADNQTSQKAITIMALFYPIPRDPFYRYKELNFWQKWSFSFGTKLSEELFKDLLLGLNFEFSKGGNFTGGIHYGQHRVVQGYKKFDFGKDLFTGKFDNKQTNLRWDVGIFLGVTLDLRIVNALRSNGQDQKERNKTQTNSN